MPTIFRQHMPYALRYIENGAWEFFNRDYKTIGEPFFLKKSLTQATRDALARPPITQNEYCIWLYCDAEHPLYSAVNWEAYSKRLARLGNLKIKD